jgi:hypothetical protein
MGQIGLPNSALARERYISCPSIVSVKSTFTIFHGIYIDALSASDKNFETELLEPP